MNKIQIKFMIDSLRAKKNYNELQYKNNVINENEYKHTKGKLAKEIRNYELELKRL